MPKYVKKPITVMVMGAGRQFIQKTEEGIFLATRGDLAITGEPGYYTITHVASGHSFIGGRDRLSTQRDAKLLLDWFASNVPILPDEVTEAGKAFTPYIHQYIEVLKAAFAGTLSKHAA